MAQHPSTQLLNNDAHVQGTNDDAQISKLSCVKLGYFNDDFVKYFVRRPLRRAPLINRGYYSRYAALRGLLFRFLALPNPPQEVSSPQPACITSSRGAPSVVSGGRQVLSLGAGFDTTFFQLAKEGKMPSRYVEVDFKEVACRKAAVIQHTPELLSWLGPPEFITIDVEEGRVVSPTYTLLPADLRTLPTLGAALEGVNFDFEAPTFVLSECVLVYMEAAESVEVVRWLGSRLKIAAMAIYEQIRPDDAFGQQMLLNLECRGCSLKGIRGTPDLESQRRRFTENGWDRAEARSMDDIYRSCLEPADRRRIERLELFDEFEEWNLIQAHYCIALGIKDAPGGLLEGFGFPQHDPSLPAALQTGSYRGGAKRSS